MAEANATRIVAGLRALHIETERDRMIRRHLHRLLKRDDDGNLMPVPCRFTAGQETRGVVMIEASGGGKTAAIQRVLKETTALGPDPGTGVARYLSIQVPSPASLKSVGLAILEATGLRDVVEKTPTWEVWKIVRHRLPLLGIVALWLDEAQDLVLAKSASETETTLRMLKTLMQGEHAIILILSGTEQLARMTSFDPQVSRRFTKITPMDLEFGVDEADLADLIGAFCSRAGLTADISGDLAGRLIKASRQRFGRAVETIIDAIECALEDGDNALTSDHFAAVWAMQEGCNTDGNIFDIPDWLSLPLDVGAEEYEAARSQRQMKKLERS